MFRKPMLAHKKALSKIAFPCYVEDKYDGVRVIAVVEHGFIQAFTRAGHKFYCPAVYQFCYDKSDGVYDGELCVGDGLVKDRTVISGRVTSAIAGNDNWQGDEKFYNFDRIPVEDWIRGKCDLTIEQRNSHRQMMSVNSAEVVQEMFNESIASGKEGLILKKYGSLYKLHADPTKFIRSGDWNKMKAVETADVWCYEEIEGQGKYVGMVGALMYEGRVDGVKVLGCVGTGLTDEMRSKVGFYKNKAIEIQYNTVTIDKKTGISSLFLPVFVDIRTDKSMGEVL